jgi:hypothetical protein
MHPLNVSANMSNFMNQPLGITVKVSSGAYLNSYSFFPLLGNFMLYIVKKSTLFMLQTVTIILLLSTDISLETKHFAYGEIPFKVLFWMPEIQLLSMLSIHWTWNFFSLDRNFILLEDCWL